MFSIIARGGLLHDAAGEAIADALDVFRAAAFGDFLAGVVEFLACDEIDRGGGGQRAGRIHRNLGAPTRPIITFGLRPFSSSANFASVGNDGVLVWMITRS
jgi:hypothetical protein